MPDPNTGMGTPPPGDDSETVSMGGQQASANTQILGTNQFQQTVAKFSTAVEKLTAAIAKMSQQGAASSTGFGSGQNQTGPTSSSQQRPQSTSSPFAYVLAGIGAVTSGGSSGTSSGTPSPPGGLATHASGGNGGGFLGTSQFGGSGGGGGTPPPTSSGGNYGRVGGAALGMAGTLSSFGAGQYATQLQLSGFVQQQMLMLPPNASNQAVANRMQQGVMGASASGGALGISNADRIQGGAILSQASGSPVGVGGLPAAQSLYGGMRSAANIAGYSNPGMGAAQAAQFGANVYSPQFNTNLRMAGFPQQYSPLRPGGTRNTGASVFAGTAPWLYGRQKVSQQQLALTMRPGGIGYTDINAATGGNQQMNQAWIQGSEAYNKVMNVQGMTQKRATQLFNQAASGQQGAQNTLNQYGIKKSDFQDVKDVQQQSGAKSADIADSFNAGLQTATTSLTGFNKILNQILSLPGVNQGIGGAGGLLGTFRQIANPGNLLGGIGALSLLRGRGGLGGGDTGGATKGIFGSGGPGGAAGGAGGVKGFFGRTAGGTGAEAAGGIDGASLAGTIAPVVVATLAVPAVANALGNMIDHKKMASNNQKIATKDQGFNSHLWGPARTIAGLTDDISRPVFAAGATAYGAAGTAINWMHNTGADFLKHFASGGVSKGKGSAKAADLTMGGMVAGAFDSGQDTETVKVRVGEGILIPEATKALGGEDTIDNINQAFKNFHSNHGNAVSGGAAMQHFKKGGVVRRNSSNAASSGGYRDPLRSVQGLQQAGIDMGVDFAGHGPVYAVGPGTIEGIGPSGWPGKSFITERLSTGPYKGKLWYAAENIAPRVRPGQHVTTNTVIGNMIAGYPDTEWGFAANPSGLTMAAAKNGVTPDDQYHGKKVSTAFGLLAAQFLHSLGAPMGSQISSIVGNTKGWKDYTGHGTGGGGANGGGSGNNSTTTSSAGGGGGAPQGYSTSEADNVAGAMGAGGGGGVTDTTSSSSGGGGGGTNGSGAHPGGSVSNGLLGMAKGLMNRGYSRAAVAGIAGAVAGESGGNPGSHGSNGYGLIGWTPQYGGDVLNYQPGQYPPHSFFTPSEWAAHAVPKMGSSMTEQVDALMNWAKLLGAPPSAMNKFKQPLDAYHFWYNHVEDPQAAGSYVDLKTGAMNTIYKDLANYKSGHAKGTSSAPPGYAWVGERGPELKWMDGGERIKAAGVSQHLATQAAKRPAERPWASQLGDMFTSPATAQSNTSLSGNGDFILNFAQGAIQITGGGTGTNEQITHSAREIVRQTAQQLERNQTIKNIMAGVK